MLKVSVIVPVYNGEKHLRECLDSIRNQTLTDIEIICVDDGSTDSSLEILREYQAKDDRFQIYTQENKYAGVARNLGKSHATGEYLVFWDCDDFFDLQALGKLYNKAKSVDADVCVCGGNQFWESTQKLYPWPPYLNPKRVPAADAFNRFSNPDYYLNFTTAVAWNKIFRREYIESLQLDFQPIRNGNDVYFTMNALGLAERITILNEKLINYRVNENSGLVSSLSKSPLAPVNAWIAIAENLEKYEGFGERSFANKALGSMIYLLQNLQDWEAFEQAYVALKEYGFEKLHIIPREDYYYDRWSGEFVEHFYRDSAEEFIIFYAYSMYMQKSRAYAECRGKRQEFSEQKKECKQLARDLQTADKKLEETNKKLKDTDKQLKEANRKLDETSAKLQETRSSWSFKIGKVLVWLPGKIKSLIKK